MEKIKRKQYAGFSNLEISSLEGIIIASFFPEMQEMTIKEIQKRVDYSYERINSAMKSLAKKKIVKEKQKGKTLIYTLDKNSIYAGNIGFRAYNFQRKTDFIKKHKILYNAIKEITTNQFTREIILFGSYSKNNETKQSDVDLIVTGIPGKEKEIEKFIFSLKSKYGMEFSPVIIPLHEFSEIRKDNPELWNDLKLYGIVFKGNGIFYYWMYENEKN